MSQQGNAGLCANMDICRLNNQCERKKSSDQVCIPSLGDIYRQCHKTTGPELEARSANATAKSDTNKNCDAKSGIRGLDCSLRSSLGVWEMAKG